MLRRPTSAEELRYYTCRKIEGKGRVRIWVFKGEDIANIEYTCPKCGYSGEKTEKMEWKTKYVEENGKRKKKRFFYFKCDNCGYMFAIEEWASAAKRYARRNSK